MKFKLSTLAVLSLFAQSAFGFEPFTIQNIRIEGAERTEAGTIYNYFPVHVGEKFDSLRAQQGITALFATGFFSDVRLDVDGADVVVVVKERPIISKLTFTGIKEISEDDMRKSLKGIGISEARIYDQANLDVAIQELRNQYHGRGKYSAIVTAKITDSGPGKVDVSIEASEGLVAKISDINIVGNSDFSEKKLLGKLSLSKSTWWVPFSSSDKYSKSRLESDEETLRSFYMNNGYINFDLSPSLVTISPDKKDINISMFITEGERFAFDNIKFAGDFFGTADSLAKVVVFKKGEVFSKVKVATSINKIMEYLGDDGYAFATVNAIPELDANSKKVDFTFYIDIGKRVYVNNINVSGNTVTRDEVIRRELRQLESTLYSAKNIKRSKERLDLLGFFSDVAINPVPTPNANDKVDLSLEVVEKETGNIQLGLGLSQGQGVVLNASISQNNIFGSGNKLDLKLNGSKVNKVYSLSYTNPYWTMDGVSRSFDVFQRYVDPTGIDLGAYTTETIGTRIRFGVPVSETNSIYYAVGYETQSMKLYDNSPRQYFDFVNNFGDKYSTVLTTVGWSSDERDSYISPTRGMYTNVSLESALPISDIKYFKINFQQQWFYPVTEQLTFMINGELGYASGYSGQVLPFYLNFYGGGVQSVRGYRSGSFGPRDSSDNSLGGDRKINGNIELFFPLPNMEDDKSVRSSFFIDGGWVYGAGDRFALEKLRYSGGMALSWISPFGPLKFSLGYPLNKKSGDKTQIFQFTLGNIF